MTKSQYIDFCIRAKYDEERVNASENGLNLPYYRGEHSIKDFFTEQRRKFGSSVLKKSNDDLTGCCLNFSAYVMQLTKGLLLTCPDGINENGSVNTHCAVCHLVKHGNGGYQLVVTEPSDGVIRALTEDGCINEDAILKSFQIPFEKYKFVSAKNNPIDLPKEDYKVFTGDLARCEETLFNALFHPDAPSVTLDDETAYRRIKDILEDRVTNKGLVR